MEKDNFFKLSLRLFLDKIMQFLFKLPGQQKSPTLGKDALPPRCKKNGDIIKKEGVLYYGSVNTKLSTAEPNGSLFTKHEYGKARITEATPQMPPVKVAVVAEAVSFALSNHQEQSTITVIVPEPISVMVPEPVVATEMIKPLAKKAKPTVKKMSMQTLDKPAAKKAKPAAIKEAKPAEIKTIKATEKKAPASKPVAMAKADSTVKKAVSKQKEGLKEAGMQVSLPKPAPSSKKTIQKKTESKLAGKPYQRDETLQDIDSVLA